MTNEPTPPEHAKVAEYIHANLTGPKKDRMTLDDVDVMLAELVEDAENRAFEAGRREERDRPRVHLGWLTQHAAAKLGPQTVGLHTLIDGADHDQVLRAIIDELAEWRRFDRGEQDRIRRLGDRVNELLAGIRLIAELVGKGQTTHLIGEHGPALSMSAVLSGIASKLHTMMLHEIQHPRWRNDGGNRPPEDGVAKFITGRAA